MNKKETPVKKEKSYFDIRVECLMPATVSYRILAEDENDAFNQIKNKQPNNIKYNFNLKRNIKATVYVASSSIVKLVKHFIR